MLCAYHRLWQAATDDGKTSERRMLVPLQAICRGAKAFPASNDKHFISLMTACIMLSSKRWQAPNHSDLTARASHALAP
eukprot:scaffold117683_cov24-Tisochrysis_lutea.AAC.2